MRTLTILSLFLASAAGPASAQSTQVPLCTAFDAGGNPIASATNPTTACTDVFGKANWANSPLPAGSIGGFTMIAAGSGYVNPVVVITDPAGTGASASATVDPASGAITGLTLGAGANSGYVIPQISIVDVGAGGALGAPTCGVAGQPACGSGALAVATLVGPFTGGMPKFQDAFKSLQLASPDTTTFPGDDYYEIGLVQYAQQMHTNLPPTTLRGYVQLNTGSTSCAAANQLSVPAYLGPTIIATKNKAVRVKFLNCLPTGAGGDLFIPTDTTYMGAGMSANGTTAYTENRATLHLHGGLPPWISDGTPHQWTAAQGESTTLQRGASVGLVPDMWFDASGAIIATCAGKPSCSVAGATNDPGQGALSFYWTNQQGGRLMFYHDHAYGLTRLNVYAGEAAGYLLVDPAEEDALAAAGAPGTIGTTPDLAHMIPLVIQDKTFVPDAAQIGFQDPTWSPYFGTTPGTAHPGDLWFSHVYSPNQNPADPSNANAFGHWDYGPWFFPPQSTLTAANPPSAVSVSCTSAMFPGQVLGPSGSCPNCGCPIIPNPSGTPESFMDTPVVNGVAYPTLTVDPTAYRLQILSAGNDRSLNLSWFVADATGTEVPMLPAAPPAATGATVPLCSQINSLTNPGLVLGLPKALLDASGNPLNGTGLPAGCWPNYGPQLGIPKPQTMWAADGRNGGAPDPRNAGPAWIEIGTEGGLLASPVVIPPTPVNYEQNTRSITIGNVAVHGLWLGPAERADAIVDFSQFAGKTLILYNDAPAPAPAVDSRLDYFTGNGDQTPIGGAPSTQPGYGPNTRTIMQVKVNAALPGGGAPVPFSLANLKGAFVPNATTQARFGAAQPTSVFGATQPPPAVPEAAYGSAYGTTYGNTYASVQATNLVFTPVAPLSAPTPVGITPSCGTVTAPAQCVDFGEKTIQELFTLDYGRMNATLGTELPLTNFLTQTTIPLGYIDPPTEIIRKGDTQLWKITHNGVDTHFIHFHLFNVQVINRVGWDGSMRPPDENEIGWKDTVRMNPLENIVVAVQPMVPTTPFPLPNSVRLEDVTAAVGTSAQFTNIDPFTNNPSTTTNLATNYGWEYVWHCHILGHEENDMMRPIVFQVPPPAPGAPVAAVNNGVVTLTFTDNSANETGFAVQRDTTAAFTAPVTIATSVPPLPPTNAAGEGTSWGGTVTAAVDTPPAGTSWFYRVQAVDDGWKPLSAGGLSQDYNATPAVTSGWVAAALPTAAVTFTGAPASAAYGSTFTVTATTNGGVLPTITVTAGVCTVGAVSGTAASATAQVTMVSGSGTCTLTANWPAGTVSAAAATQTTTATKHATTTAITAATPSPVNVGQTVTVSFSVSVPAPALATGLAGPTGTVTVSAGAGTPSCSGAIAADGTGSCTLTFTVGGSFTLTAAYGGDANFATSTSAGRALTVRDFRMAISPTSQTLNGGTSASYTVTVSSVNGFTGAVALSCSGTFPASYTCSIPTSVTVPANRSASVTLRMNAPRGTPGTYTVTAKGSVGTIAHSVNATLRTTR